MRRFDTGWLVPVACVLVASVLSLFASWREGISGYLLRETLLVAFILGALGIGTVVAGAYYIDRREPKDGGLEPERLPGEH